MKYLLIGLGNIGSKRLALLGDRCVATVDPYNKEATYRNIRECPEDSYDAVILSVPNQVKIEPIRFCLERGKHVLVEKPLLFPDSETAHSLNEMARRHKAIWYTAYNHQFEPLIEEVKKELEAASLGTLYQGRFFYGNGTAANADHSWRGEGLGVLEDLGCHLLDLIAYLLGYQGTDMEPIALKKYESKGLDHCLLITKDQRYLLEMSLLSWKNNFQIDLYGDKGSLHLKGLCKWGPSELTIYERIRPSGVPKERRKVLTGPDVTWERDLKHFERVVDSGITSFENDSWISRVLQGLAATQ